MIIKPPKPGLGFWFWDLGFWDLVWLGLGVAKITLGGSNPPPSFLFIIRVKGDGWNKTTF